MDKKQTAKMFKALENFTSTDKTRQTLYHVYIPTPTRIEATDGHKLIRLDVPKGHGLLAGFYDPKKAAATAKADLEPTPISTQESWTWPDFEQVIPKIEDDRHGAALVGFDARYMAECMEGICGALAPWGFSSKSPGVTFRMGEDAMSPLRMDADAYGEATAVVVLMPMRL